jgi:hypothetical protein
LKSFFVKRALYENTNKNIISISNIKPKIQLTSFAANSLIKFVLTHRLLKNCKSDIEVELNNTIAINVPQIRIAVKSIDANIHIIFPTLIFSFFLIACFFSVLTNLKNNFSPSPDGTVLDKILYIFLSKFISHTHS